MPKKTGKQKRRDKISVLADYLASCPIEDIRADIRQSIADLEELFRRLEQKPK
jgi:hypothetical protein